MLRDRAALAAAPLPTTPPTPLPQGQAGGVSLADLEREQQARQAWTTWQQRMQVDFDRIAGFQGATDLQAQAWQRFLEAWKENNPTSGDDEWLRERASQALAVAQAEPQAQRLASVGGQGATSVASPGGSGTSPGQTFKDCGDCPEMVVVPAGRFLMGSPPGEAGRDADEGPQRWVDVPRFALGKFEVTQGEWLAVMGSNPSRFSNCGMNCPVENVSWNDSQEYVRRLSQRTGQNYRLPSEAEWEYAARAGTTTAYFWGDRFDFRRVYNNGRSTVPAGAYPANAFGLHDMHGNVWEWVQDVWHDSYAGAPSDGSDWRGGGNTSWRVLRGGSWYGAPHILRSADRDRDAPGNRNSLTGFRIARTF
jgi:formylglycine-generating enzyme required for sulfatase activity